jgi:hypothetical protein
MGQFEEGKKGEQSERLSIRVYVMRAVYTLHHRQVCDDWQATFELNTLRRWYITLTGIDE